MKIREFVTKHFDTLETVLLLVFAGSFVTVIMEIENFNYYFGAGAVLMGTLYWFKASERTNKKDKKYDYKEKINWYALMITPIAIFSKVRMDERSNIFMGVAIGLLIFAFSVKLHKKIAKQEEVPTSDFIRIIAAIIISLSIFALPLPNINTI